ncbi:hypothetical protein, partial [Plasmodium yoelii yoelii]
MKGSKIIPNIMKHDKCKKLNHGIISDMVKKMSKNENIINIINKILSYKKENKYVDNVNDKDYDIMIKNVKDNYNLFKKKIPNIPLFMIHSRNFRTIKNKNIKLKKYNTFVNNKNSRFPFSIHKNVIDSNHEIINNF